MAAPVIDEQEIELARLGWINPEQLLLAQTNAHKLRKYFVMKDIEFGALSAATRGQPFWATLGVEEPARKPTHAVSKLSSLRKVFQNVWAERDNSRWIRALLNGHVECTACIGRNSKYGYVVCAVDKVRCRHSALSDY